MKLRICPIFLFIFLSQLALADDNSRSENFRREHSGFFRLYKSERSDFQLAYLFQPSMEAKQGPGEYSLHSFSTEGEAPFPLSSDFFYRLGWEYSWRMYDFDKVPSVLTSTDSLDAHKLGGIFGFGWFLNDDLLITARARPGLYSDFDGGLKEEDFQILGDGQLICRVNPGTQLMAGIVVSEDFDSTPVYPELGIRILNSSGNLHLSLTAPREARVTYYFGPELALYGGAWLSGERYRISAGRAENFNLQLQERLFGVGIEFWFSSSLELKLEAGVSAGSEFDFKINSAGQFDGELDSGPYFRTQIGFSL